MNKYVFAQYGEPHFNSPEEGKEHMSQWSAWVKSLGTAMADPGVPLKATKTVSSKGVTEGDGSNRLTGYSVVAAGSFEDAVAMAKTCPHLNFGTIDVGEVMEMKMQSTIKSVWLTMKHWQIASASPW